MVFGVLVPITITNLGQNTYTHTSHIHNTYKHTHARDNRHVEPMNFIHTCIHSIVLDIDIVIPNPIMSASKINETICRCRAFGNL